MNTNIRVLLNQPDGEEHMQLADALRTIRNLGSARSTLRCGRGLLGVPRCYAGLSRRG